MRAVRSVRTAHALRLATIAAFAACGLLAWNLLNGPEPVEEVETGGEAVDVRTAIAVSRAEPLTIRGFVFDDPGVNGLRLCDGRRPGDPPRCRGPYLALERVDEGSFQLRSREQDGRRVLWSPDEVTVTGVLVGTVLTVQVVLD